MSEENGLQLFAVTESGPQPLQLPKHATNFADLYDGLPIGVYSALRTFQRNKFFRLEDHLARTERSMALLNWDFQLNRRQLCQAIHQVCTAYPSPGAQIRFDVLAQPGRQLGTESRVLIALTPLNRVPPHFYEEGVVVGFAPGLSRTRPLIKTADFTIERRTYLEDKETSFYEYLMFNEQEEILEGFGSNFYGVRDGVVWTAGEGVLEGITRKVILGLLSELDIPLRLEAVHIDDIATLDEAAISSSSRALLPVVEIEGQQVGNGRPGPICQRILAVYNAFLAKSVKTALLSV